jgi:hypothetical protein
MIIGRIPNADANNLIPVSDEAYGVSVEALTETDTRFSFNIHFGTGLVEGVNDLPDTAFGIVGLMKREGTAGPWAFVASDCLLSVEWARDIPHTGLFGTVTEIWRAGGVVLPPVRPKRGGRQNVDVGYGRSGPRYTLGLNGANYEGHVDYGQGDVPRVVVSGPGAPDGFDFPIRLVMGAGAPGSLDYPEIRDIVLEGKLGYKATLTAENKAEWGVDSNHMHFRLYQEGVIDGFPVDIDF